MNHLTLPLPRRSVFPWILLGFGFALLVTGSLQASETSLTWPQFRGPSGSGSVASTTAPESWSPEENVAWRVEVPGRGWSSPILVGDTLLLTSAIIQGEYKEPSTGLFGNEDIAALIEQGVPREEAIKQILDRDLEVTSDKTPAVSWMILALDRKTGKTLWKDRALTGQPPGGRHRKNTYASETPASDGERAYFYFANQALCAYSLTGEKMWSRSFEPRKIYLDFGTGASPVVDDHHVYVVNDNEDECAVLAIDKKTGKDVWKTVRHKGPGGSGWATPFLWQTKGRTELVTIGLRQVLSYAPQTGMLLWNLQGMTGIPAPTPIAGPELLYVTSGQPDEPIRPVFAIRPGASGNISLKTEETSNDFVAWSQPKAGTYIPTPVLFENRLYVLHDRGFLSSYHAQTGKRIYKQRIGKHRNFTSSPWIVGDKLFCLSEEGDTFVIATGDEFQELGVNRLDAMCMATPALDETSLYLRTERHLYAFRKPADSR